MVFLAWPGTLNTCRVRQFGSFCCQPYPFSFFFFELKFNLFQGIARRPVDLLNLPLNCRLRFFLKLCKLLKDRFSLTSLDLILILVVLYYSKYLCYRIGFSWNLNGLTYLRKINICLTNQRLGCYFFIKIMCSCVEHWIYYCIEIYLILNIKIWVIRCRDELNNSRNQSSRRSCVSNT